MLARGMTEENVEAALAMSKKWMTPAGMFFMGIISVTFWSAIIALITSAILKKDPSPFNQNSSNE
jgi:cell division protein FtsN